MKKSNFRSSLLAAAALSVSIAAHLHADVFPSAATGDWSNPASWTPPGAAPFPNTYGADSAVIGAGHTIHYDGLGTTFPFGNLTVANSNAITINGGTLDQTWAPAVPPATGTAIAIGVTGAVDGKGELNLNAGGNFNSGTANAVAVGITLSALGVATGDGTVNVNNGTFLMGPNSGVNPNPADPPNNFTGDGLGIGIDTGAVGRFFLGDGLPGAAILDVRTNNALLTVGGTLNEATGGTGFLTIKSDGELLAGPSSINIGDDGGTGTLTIDPLGKLTGIGTPSPGVGGTTGGILRIGTGANSLGTMTSRGVVTGVGEFVIGRDGSGTLVTPNVATIAAGSFNAQTTYVGRNGGVGILNVTGGSFTTGEDRRDGGSRGLRIGVDGTGSNGTLNVSGGGVVHQTGWMDVGLGAGNTGKITVSGAGSQFLHEDLGANNDGSIGRDGGTGKLEITNGGRFITNFWLNAGRGGASSGDILVDGVGSQLIQNNTGLAPHMNIGEQGAGTLTIDNGGVVRSWEMWVGRNSGATGRVDIKNGSSLSLNHWLAIGNGGGTGEVNVDGPGSKLTMLPVAADRGDTQVGIAGGNGKINVTNGGNFTTSWWINIARDAGSTGAIKIEGPGSTVLQGSIGGDMRTNVGEHGTGRIDILAGGKFQKFAGSETAIARENGSIGTVIVDGPGSLFHQRAGDLIIGTRGQGRMEVKNGGEVRVNTGGVGTVLVGAWNGDANGSGTLIVDGPTSAFNGLRDPEVPDFNAANGARLNIGNESATSGTVRITNGGTASFLSVTLGNQGQGTINQDSGTLNVGQWLEIGQDRNADVASDLPNGIRGNEATYNLSGGTLNARQLIIGSRRKGTMTMSGGTINMGSNGTTTIDAGAFAIGFFGNPDGGGAHGDGLFVQTGGAINSYGKNLQIAFQGGTSGQYDMVSGTLNLNPALDPLGNPNAYPGLRNIEVGQNGIGTLNVGKVVALGDPVPTDPVISGVNYFNVAGNNGEGGAGSTGTLNVNFNNPASTLHSREFYSGFGTGSVGVTLVKKGILQTEGLVEVGRNGGTGTVNIDGPTAVWQRGLSAGGFNSDMQIGFSGGTGNLNVTNGGTVTNSWWINIARGATSTGNVTVDGANSKIVLTGGGDINLNVGEDGIGTMTVSNGGTVTHNDAQSYRTHVSRNSGSTGKLELNTGGKVDVTELFVGSGGGTNGEVNIKSGGAMTVQNWLAVGTGVGTTGTITVDGPGSSFVHKSNLYGRNGGGGGDNQIGFQGGTGTVNVTNGGKFEAGWWLNIARNDGTAGTKGFVNVTGAGSLLKVDGSGFINLGEDGEGTMNVTSGGKVDAVGSGDFVLGKNAGSMGTLTVKTGGIVLTPFLRAGAGMAKLTLEDGGILQASRDEANFLQGFDNGALHSAIRLEGTGGTIDSNGRRVRVIAGNVIAGLDVNPADGLLGTALTIAGDATLFNNTDKVTLEVPVGTGTLSIHVLSGGFLDLEVSQTLDALVIDAGGYVELSALSSPPGAPAAAPLFDEGMHEAAPASPGLDALATASVQGVPEPGTIALLLVSALGMLGRPTRRKQG